MSCLPPHCEAVSAMLPSVRFLTASVERFSRVTEPSRPVRGAKSCTTRTTREAAAGSSRFRSRNEMVPWTFSMRIAASALRPANLSSRVGKSLSVETRFRAFRGPSLPVLERDSIRRRGAVEATRAFLCGSIMDLRGVLLI